MVSPTKPKSGTIMIRNADITFRRWCQEKWYEHCEEVEAWTGRSPRYLIAEYFGKYKWWLRREFRAWRRSHS